MKEFLDSILETCRAPGNDVLDVYEGVYEYETDGIFVCRIWFRELGKEFMEECKLVNYYYEVDTLSEVIRIMDLALSEEEIASVCKSILSTIRVSQTLEYGLELLSINPYNMFLTNDGHVKISKSM